MRFLLVVPPLAGHVAPLRGVAEVLSSRGHTVAWCGPEPALSTLVSGTVFPAGDSAPFELSLRPPGLRGFAALKYLWESYLVPLADAMVPGVASAVSSFAPDVVVADQQAMAGALVAARCGLPWATSASTSTELADPLGSLPKIASWVSELQAGLRARHGVLLGDLRFSPHLVLAFTTRALAGDPRLAVPVAFVGPVLPSPSDDWSFVDSRPLVVVTLGTSNASAGARFLAESVDALAGMPSVQGLVVDPAGSLISGSVSLARRIPQVAVFARASVVVCHGGHNTVCEALAAGVPLVVAPIRDDQSMLAQQVVAASAGVRLRFDRAKAADIGKAIESAPEYTEGAARIRESFEAAGGAEAAATHLESLG
ncbi:MULTISPECIES: glycosyltransferase [unclassified Amycolatopsis]|uniref:glycosyltransferase n=1 Tax=unclassified Amycolatopsis TaxID=2618356 RepID=UPI002874B65A|nr:MULTISPECIES: glycosyltransferase [unclassified Amycolatopsis]MDS0132048.1 glycosyltransferase family 1 protein [Amycolatopsis sp. 505]MDS0141214.1 glycosyltransferase family 1 protein [Amycolatopsis sp. CM201R]